MLDDLKSQLDTANEHLKEYIKDAAPASEAKSAVLYTCRLPPLKDLFRLGPSSLQTMGKLQSQRRGALYRRWNTKIDHQAILRWIYTPENLHAPR